MTGEREKEKQKDREVEPKKRTKDIFSNLNCDYELLSRCFS